MAREQKNTKKRQADAVVSGRVPPYNLDAEKVVLSAILLDNDALYRILNEVRDTDFYHPAHQTIFAAMLALKDANQPVDLHTLSDYLNGAKTLDSVGGPVFLAELADYAATSANIVHHARIVHDKSVKRALISVASEIVETAFDQDDSAEGLLDVAESKIFGLSQQKGRSDFTALHTEMTATFDHIEKLMQRAGSLTGIPTGFKAFDEMTGGLQSGELVILAARPSMGKTALALNMARHAAVEHGKRVAVFSMEMNTQSLILRMLSSEARIDASMFRRGIIPMSDYRRLSEAATVLSEAPIYIDETGGLSILEIRARARRLAAEHGLDLVILDYLQLAHGERRTDRKDLEIAEISAGLKGLAKELRIPVIALAQLNRGPEQRDPDKRRPMMGDLRDSGAIEQDADVVCFIYRDEFYNKESEDVGKAELIIAKQRNGPTGTVKLSFQGQYALFGNLTEREEEAMPHREASFSGPPSYTDEDIEPF